MGSHSEGRVTHENRKSILSTSCSRLTPGFGLLLTVHTQDGGHTTSAFIWHVDCVDSKTVGRLYRHNTDIYVEPESIY